MFKLTQPQKQALVSVGIFGQKATIGTKPADKLKELGLIYFERSYGYWKLTEKGEDVFVKLVKYPPE